LKYKILADSSCDVTDEIKKNTGVELVPLTLRLDDKEYVDDHNLDLKSYLKAMKESKTAPKTACPSIQDFLDRFRDSDNIFVVTISSKLSGTYNSAMQAKEIIKEEFQDKFIHVFDSMSAAIGETLVHLKVHESLKANLKNNEIVDKVNNYIKEMKTFFLLENLDNLAKSGRLNPIVAKAANMLSIKPIMGSQEGAIRLVEKVRGYERAFQRLVDVIGEEGSNLENKVLGIAHCNCIQRALKFKEKVMERYRFKDIIVVEMAGLSSTYANEGGLVIAF
jgi:DegV family protein with EDD domain